MDLILILIIAIIFILYIKNIVGNFFSSNGNRNKHNINVIEHKKKFYLATKNEQMFLTALKEAINNRYMVHCQTSLISLVEPIVFKYKGLAWSKRVDFVITDDSTRIVAVIELDDLSHNLPKRIERDRYVNHALSDKHPFIRIKAERFYSAKKIAFLLEKHAGISDIFRL